MRVSGSSHRPSHDSIPADGPGPAAGATMPSTPHDGGDIKPHDSPVREVHIPMALRSADRALSPVDVALRIAIVGLALSTGYIHSTLGGVLFTLNAVGYLVAAVAMVIPLPLAIKYRWVVRLGLMGYAATTIIGWAIQGPYYTTAYIAKAIEVVLITLLAVDFARMDGNPVPLIKNEINTILAKLGRRSATTSSNA